MSYDTEYKNRNTAKKHLTKRYLPEEINDIKILIKKYFETASPNELINTNPAYFNDLADAINESCFNHREVVKPKYLSEIYNGTSYSKNKNIEKMTNIKKFLLRWLDIHHKSKKEQLSEGVNGILNDWNATINDSTPQWADYVSIPIKSGTLKRFKYDIFTKSKYYRIGFKFLRLDGKLFGDGTIQSLDNNFVIHVGKNFTDKDLFITTYRNGILERPDKYTNIIPRNNTYKCELYLDTESFLHFFINNTEVYKGLVNKEILSRVYMLAWGDGNKVDIKTKNIKIEIERA
jgi:hypothetical protein